MQSSIWNENIDEFIKSEDFCDGSLSVDAYNTAWVARIRNPNKQNEPAFPQSLEWIRKHQLQDGSWGSKYPVFIFERVVSILISVICLKQWAMDSDVPRIARGVRYITEHLKHLMQLEMLQDQMTIGFELILPSLIDEANSLGIDFGNENVIQVYREEKKKKMNKLIQCEKAGMKFIGQRSWCFTLEGLDNLYSNEEICSMVSQTGGICCSYSATAFALFKGIVMERSLDQISKVVFKNNGGVPTLYNVKIFDLSWSLFYLVLSGYKMDNIALNVHVDKLKVTFLNSGGYLGGAIELPPDADITSNIIFTLATLGKIRGPETLDGLMKFYRGNYFITFEAERHPSLSTNINALIALKHFQEFPNIRKITHKVFEWTKSKIIDSGYQFQDKWNLSQIYSMSRALIAFDYIDHEFSRKIFEIFLSNQNKDGGWGSCGRSTHLETSYSVLSMVYYLKDNMKLKNGQTNLALKNAKNFMKNHIYEPAPLWISKTLYSAINIDKTTILAAKFALGQITE